MFTYEVKDMTCGHCVSSIIKAVSAVDPAAQLTVNLATHRVEVELTQSSEAALGEAIRGAGFTPVPVAVSLSAKNDAPTAPASTKQCCKAQASQVPASAARSSCCCH